MKNSLIEKIYLVVRNEKECDIISAKAMSRTARCGERQGFVGRGTAYINEEDIFL